MRTTYVPSVVQVRSVLLIRCAVTDMNTRGSPRTSKGCPIHDADRCRIGPDSWKYGLTLPALPVLVFSHLHQAILGMRIDGFF